MRVAVFSDVHGNLPALEAFIEETRDEVDAYVCLGDIVNYGPWSNECLDLIAILPNVVVLEGNHERLFLGSEDICHEIPLVQRFYSHAVAGFSRKAMISSLPARHELGSFTCIHTIDNKRIFRDTEIEIDRNYLIGHTHHAFDVLRSGYQLVNCGSLGQNRKDLRQASFAVMDLERGSIELRELSYDWERLIAEMECREYHPDCLAYYRSKLG